MKLNNIKYLLLKSLNKSWKQEQVIKSIIWNSIINDFKNKKNIDITSYLISIKLMGETIMLKTNKPIINAELLNIEKELIENIITKLNNIWINIKIIKFRFK